MSDAFTFRTWLRLRLVTYPRWLCRLLDLHAWGHVGEIRKSYSDTKWSWTVVFECWHCGSHKVVNRLGPKLPPAEGPHHARSTA
ncbi:MAG: hypothetical protein AAGA99_27840 [Actinomycetota bacterium]